MRQDNLEIRETLSGLIFFIRIQILDLLKVFLTWWVSNRIKINKINSIGFT